MGKASNASGEKLIVFSENLEENDGMEDLGVDAMTLISILSYYRKRRA